MQTLAEREVDLGSMTGDELSARIREIEAERNRIDICLAETVAALDARQHWAADGAISPSTWLAWQCDMSRGSARRLVRTARRLRSMPLTVAAAKAGRLGAAKVVLLARAAGHGDAAADAFARHEAVLVEHAQKLSVDQLAVLLREWLMRVDAEAGEKDEKAQHEGRRLHISRTLDGTWALNGTLADEAGSWLSAALEREGQQIKANEKATGTPPSTAAQRRADALIALCKGVAESAPRT